MNSRSSIGAVHVGRVVPERGELGGRAVEDDPAADEDEPRDDVLDGAELVRDVEDRDAELGAQLGEQQRRATPATRRRRPWSARRARAASGSVASAFAMNARCCMPPESVRSGASARSPSPTRSIACATAARSAARSGPNGPRTASRPASTTSRTVDGRRRRRAATAGRGSRLAARRAAPGGCAEDAHGARAGRSSPSASRSSVVLPPPFGPAMPTNVALLDGER